MVSNAQVVSQIATFEGRAWRAVSLREEHADSLTRLYEDCVDYFELVQGAPPGPAEVQSAFTSLPEGKTYEDKFAFVLLDQDQNVFGHLELIRDYPTSREWWVGILLLSPDKRGRGIGAEVDRSAGEWVRAYRGGGLQLSVVEANQAAVGFWRHVGYEEIERKGPRRMDRKDHSLVVLRRPL